MNRRNFLRNLVGGVATAAAVRTFPFRVFSFPATVVKPKFYSTYIMGQDAIFSEPVPALTVADIRRAIAQLKDVRPMFPDRVVYSFHPEVHRQLLAEMRA